MVRVDLLIDDPLLAKQILTEISGDGITVNEVRGEAAALTGAEIDHIIQIVAEGIAYAAIKDLTLRLKHCLVQYWNRRASGFTVVVDGIRYRVDNDSDLDPVLNAIAEASARADLSKNNQNSV